jgi:hypothetical protein
MIAGTGSGVGKTTVTVALLRAFSRRGLTVSAFKVGPDFLDPTYLAIASGRPCHNLDGWMMGTAYAADLFERASRDADLSVVEGVMGLYDGRPIGEGSPLRSLALAAPDPAAGATDVLQPRGQGPSASSGGRRRRRDRQQRGSWAARASPLLRPGCRRSPAPSPAARSQRCRAGTSAW